MSGLKLSQRQHLFVLAILDGASQVQAYRAAGYKCGLPAVVNANANRLANSDSVKAALVAARSLSMARASITVDTIIERLEEARRIALQVDPPQTAAAVAAAMGQAKVLGLIIDRSEVHVTRDKPSLLPTKVLEL